MKIGRGLGILGGLLLTTSCSVEKENLSPTKSIFDEIQSYTPKNIQQEIENQSNFILYSSEITNSFKEVKNLSYPAINPEIYNLQFYITEFIYATQAYNDIDKEKAFSKYEKAYKKVKKLKNKLPDEEQQRLNQFLVKVKTNMSLIETIKDNL